MRGRPGGFSVNHDMYPTLSPRLLMLANSRPSELDRARRRRDQAAQGSPDWDAASEAVLELEAADALVRAGRPHRTLFLLEPSSAR
jgi:hypothetical protein